MSSKDTNTFNKENLKTYLKELAKEYRKLIGKNMPAEIILVGGAAILANYGFRGMTTDVDAIIRASSAMKEAANRVGDKFNLPNNWLNSDFTKTSSYSRKLSEHSVYFCSLSNVLEVRTIKAEYLIAMKLMSGRKFKNDRSDVLGILAEHEKSGNPISFEKIKKAAVDLYDSWEAISEDSRSFIQDIFKLESFEEEYTSTQQEEKELKNLLIDFENDYPHVTTQDNVNDILKNLERKVKSTSSLADIIEQGQERYEAQKSSDKDSSLSKHIIKTADLKTK